MTQPVKIQFDLEQDEDGYPPFRSERLWAMPLPDGTYSIDSIPFFVMGISAEDVVEALDVDGMLRFQRLVRASGISTFRIAPNATEDLESVRADVIRLGGRCESSEQLRILAVEIAEAADILPFLDYLLDEKEKGGIDFEEGALRHSLP